MKKSYLIVKTSAIGDVIQAFSSLEYLKTTFPDAEIDWVCEKGIAPLVLAHPYIDRVLIVDTKKWKKALLTLSTYKEIKAFVSTLRKKRYDAVIDLQGNTKSGVLTFFANSSRKIGFGRSAVSEWANALFTNEKVATEGNVFERHLQLCKQACPTDLSEKIPKPALAVGDEEKTRIDEALKDRHNKIAIGIGSRWVSKKLSKEAWIAFLRFLQKELDVEFVLPITSQEREEAIEITSLLNGILIENLSLAGCSYLISSCRAYIGVDSALLHLAQRMRVPVFGIFGPSSSAYYLMKDGHIHGYQGGCPYGEVFDKRCSYLRSCHSAPCLKALPLEGLKRAFLNFWEEQVTFSRSRASDEKDR